MEIHCADYAALSIRKRWHQLRHPAAVDQSVEFACRPNKRSLFVVLLFIHVERLDGVMWTGLVWLRIGTGGELL
jgi:hypothetical protein